MFFSRYTAALLAAVSSFAAVQSVKYNRRIEFVNQSGKKLAVEWVNPKTGELVPFTSDFGNGQKMAFDTFVNHTFAVHEVSANETCSSVDGGNCNIQIITVNEDSQIAVVKRGLEIVYEDENTRAHNNQVEHVTQNCRQRAQEYLRDGYDASEVMEDLATCLQDHTTLMLQAKSEEITFESQLRTAIASELENHTCAEIDKPTSEPVEIRTWTNKNVTRNVFVMHNRPASQIHVLKNFISPEECQAIQDAAAPKLHRGTVANGKGGHRLSEHRKAWQAGLKIPWNKEDDPIGNVMRRVYDYTNDVVGYNLTYEGQEDLMSIQYFGVGRDSDESPDQYRPHCDGDCDGLPHKMGGRVATMVMYCTVPEVGGATNFQHANVYVKPELGAAAFFSYMDPKTMLKETGFTTHSGCPVIEGTKRIAVHWMRIGVDKENPWDSFNTLTIKKGEEDC